MRASLLDPNGATRAAQELRLWADDEAVTTRQLSKDAVGSASGSQTLLIADASVTVVPDDVELFPLDDGRFFGVLHRPSSGPQITLKIGDDVVWTDSIDPTKDSVVRRLPICASLVSVVNGDGAKKNVLIALTETEGLELSSVWYGKAELGITRRSATTSIVELQVPATYHEVDLLVVVRSAKSGIAVKRLRVDIPVKGFFRLRNGEMELCPSTRSITRASIAEGRYVFLPEHRDDTEDWSRTEWALYEGPRPLGRMPVRGQPRLAPIGLGWPMSARYRPVNSEDETQLCSAIVDFGDLRANHDLNPTEDGIITVGLQDSSVDQLDEYSLVIWDRDGRVVSGTFLEIANSARGYTDVRGLANAEVEYPIAIGLSYQGYRAGAIWRTSWYKYVRELAVRGPERAAGILRWLQLPVATPHGSTAIRHEILESSPLALIRGFSSQLSIDTDDGALSLLLCDAGIQQPSALDTPWFYVLREVVGQWLPSHDTVEAFVNACVEGVPHTALKPTPLIVALSNLVRISPRLAVGTALRYADACGGGPLRKSVLGEFASHVAESNSDLQRAANEELLQEQAADTLGTILRQTIDPVFVRSLVDRAVVPNGWMGSVWSSAEAAMPQHRCDSQLLCQFPDGRRLLTIRGSLLAGSI